MIDAAASWWQANGIAFAVGALTLTGLGALIVACLREPVLRQRTAQWTLGTVFVWLGLALVPRSAPDAPPIRTTTPLEVAAAPTQRSTARSHAAPRVASVDPAAASTIAPARRRTAAPAPRAATPDVHRIAGGLFLGGAILAVTYLLISFALVVRILRRARPAPQRVQQLAVGIPHAPRRLRVLESDQVGRPFCCGLVRPRIVLPSAGLGPDPQPVLLHELAHIRHRDLWGQALFACALPLLYWNPLFWWLRRDARLAAELLADGAAARELGTKTYVRGLVEAAARLDAPSGAPGAMSLALFRKESEFFRRMSMLIERQSPLSLQSSPRQTRCLRWGALVLAGIASLGWSASSLDAQQRGHAPTPTPSQPAGEQAQTIEVEVSTEHADFGALGSWMAQLADSGIEVTLDRARKGKGKRVEAVLTLVGTEDALSPRAMQQFVGTASIVAYRAQRVTPAPVPRVAPTPTAKTIEAVFEDADIREVIATCAKEGGLNIVTSPDVRGSVTMNVRGITAEQALRAAVETLGFSVDADEAGILRITASR